MALLCGPCTNARMESKAFYFLFFYWFRDKTDAKIRKNTKSTVTYLEKKKKNGLAFRLIAYVVHVRGG